MALSGAGMRFFQKTSKEEDARLNSPFQRALIPNDEASFPNGPQNKNLQDEAFYLLAKRESTRCREKEKKREHACVREREREQESACARGQQKFL
mmetsp:Transcript_32833/g.52877  ORF Transcript_32833/g.52877 Transcript_32833/m.52877 type:complete len:95 (+) Transcript_32833:1397-1681(+)